MRGDIVAPRFCPGIGVDPSIDVIRYGVDNFRPGGPDCTLIVHMRIGQLDELNVGIALAWDFSPQVHCIATADVIAQSTVPHESSPGFQTHTDACVSHPKIVGFDEVSASRKFVG